MDSVVRSVKCELKSILHVLPYILYVYRARCVRVAFLSIEINDRLFISIEAFKAFLLSLWVIRLRYGILFNVLPIVRGKFIEKSIFCLLI